MGGIEVKEAADGNAEGGGKDGEGAAGRFCAPYAEDPEAERQEEGAEDGREDEIGRAVAGGEGVELDRDGLGLTIGLEYADRDGLAGEEALEDGGDIGGVVDVDVVDRDETVAEANTLVVKEPGLMSPLDVAPLKMFVCSKKAPMKGVLSQDEARNREAMKATMAMAW